MLLQQLLRIEKVYTYKCVSLKECREIIEECLLWQNIDYIIEENKNEYNQDNEYYKYILKIIVEEEDLKKW